MPLQHGRIAWPAPGGGPGNRPAGFISALGERLSDSFGTFAFGPVAGRSRPAVSRSVGRPAGRREEDVDDWASSVPPSLRADGDGRERTLHVLRERPDAGESEFLPKGGNPRPLWSGELPRAESPAREPAGRQARRGGTCRARTPARPPTLPHLRHGRARSRPAEPDGPPDPVVLLRSRSPFPRGGGRGESGTYTALFRLTLKRFS